jgi:hypothetical protein
LAQAKSVQPYHRVLKREVWVGREGARRLGLRGASRLAPTGPLLMGLDQRLERRRGARLRAKGLSREPGRAAPRYRLTARGGRGLRLRRLGPMPWGKRVWALPCLTMLAPCERDPQARDQRHQQLTDGARPRFRVV